MRDVDPRQAVAESQLERLDDQALADGGPDPEPPLEPLPSGVDEAEYGFHLDDPGADLLDDDLDAGLRSDVEADALDVAADAFNARDLDALLEVVAPDGEAPGLLGYDRDNLADAVEDLWHRRPTAVVTRGRVEADHVGVLWEHDGAAWWRVAVVHVADVVDGRVGVLEFGDDPDLLERVEAEPPADDLEEGARWVEWDSGEEA